MNLLSVFCQTGDLGQSGSLVSATPRLKLYEECLTFNVHRYRRTATNSAMRRSPINAVIAPIKSSAITGDARSNSMVSWRRGRYIWSNCTLKVFISSRYQTLPLVEAFEPFSKFAFTDTPLVTEFKSRQLFALQHTQHSALRHLEHVSGLPESQKTERISVVFHRGS